MKKIIFIITLLLMLLFLIVMSSFSTDATLLEDSYSILEYRFQGAMITVLGVVVIWIILYIYYFKSVRVEPKVKKTIMSDRYIDVSKKEMQSYGININDFKKMAFNKFVLVHIAFSNLDFENLKLNLTKDLYDYYVDELNIMKSNGILNVIRDIELFSVKVYKIINTHQLLQVSVYLNVRMFDYMYDINSDKCVRGNQFDKTSYEFELVFENRGDGLDLSSQFVLSQKKCINEMSIKNIDNESKKN